MRLMYIIYFLGIITFAYSQSNVDHFTFYKDQTTVLNYTLFKETSLDFTIRCTKPLNDPISLEVAVKYASCLVSEYSETKPLEIYNYTFNCGSSLPWESFKLNTTKSNGYYTIHLKLYDIDPEKLPPGNQAIGLGSFFASHSKLGILSPDFAWHFFLNIGQIIVRLIFLIIWSVFCLKNRKNLLHIQIMYGVLLFIGFITNITFINMYDRLIHNLANNIRIGFVLSSIHLISLHYLLIVIAMGFGITRAFGGRQLKWTIVAILIFAVCHLSRAFLPVEFSIARTVTKFELISMVLIILFEVILIFWFVFLMKTTIQEIRIRKTLGKLKPYNWMSVVVIIALLLSVSYIITNTLFSRVRGTKPCRYVQDMSIDNAVWSIILSFIEFSMFFIWLPSKNNSKLSDGVIVDFTDDLYNFYNPASSSKDDKDSMPLYERSDATFENAKFRRFKSLHENDDSSVTEQSQNAAAATADSNKPFIQNNPKFDPSKDDPLQWIEDNVPTISANDPTVVLNDAEVIYEKTSAASKIQ